MNKLFTGIFAILLLLTSCSKENEVTVPMDVQKQLESFEWSPIVSAKGTTNEQLKHKPKDCEKDNVYTFTFAESANKLTVNRGKELCANERGTFEGLIFAELQHRAFSYDKEKKSIKFADDDPYQSYEVQLDGDQLILISRNNNPAAYVIPFEYYFQGKRTAATK
ncbi:hypothetical protein I6I97_04930 [Sphingobacterium multivorum]|uniref:hypothetical protein n=1 Tax=Sphingobacterium multivorum TaxID=28454 RepID=UPI00191AFF59|nr:hypothetical protein [Sphingobacterium multivorum]QQT63150.1 hypothetical protein I6I97_04930 [Sphingobacterium multivorum]